MSMKRSAGLVCASLLAAAVATAAPQGAKAESGFLWLDSAYALPPPARHVNSTRETGEPYKGGWRSLRGYVSPAPGPALFALQRWRPRALTVFGATFGSRACRSEVCRGNRQS